MTPYKIETELIGLLKELQAGTGEPPCEIVPTTAPLKDLSFFDSLLALETTIALEERLGTTFDQDSVFSDENSSEPLTISQIAERVAKISGSGA